MTKGVEINT